MAVTNRFIPKGELGLFTSGSYSDYGLLDCYVATADLDPLALTAMFRAEREVDQYGYWPESEIMIWLLRQGLIEDCECSEWHLPDTYPYKGDEIHLNIDKVGQ